MGSFTRAAKYSLRYRRYLAIAIFCVLVGGLCYGGGIGTIFPIIKLIISDEGPQGAADIRLTESMLGVTLRTVDFSATTPIAIDTVEDESPAARLGLTRGCTILQLDGQPVFLPTFTRTIARKKAYETIQITWRDPDDRRRRGTLELSEPRFDVRFLAGLAELLPRGEDNRFRTMIYILTGFWLINIVQSAMRFLQNYSASIMIERGLADLRTQVYERALNLPLSFYSIQGGTSDITSRFIRDAPSIRRGLNLLFTQTMLEPFKFLVALALGLYCSWKLTIVVLAVAPIVLILIGRFGQLMKKATRRSLQLWAKILGQLNETLGNIRVVKAYGSESYERTRFFQANKVLLKYLIRIARIEAATSPTIAIMGVSMAALGILFACKQVLPPDPTMKPGTLFLFFGAIFGMAESLRKLSSVPNKIQAANAAATRVFEVLDQPAECEDRTSIDLPALAQSIVFRNVSFTYPGSSAPAVTDVNLTVPKGHTVALVGPNGSGKSTLISLLPRFFDPDVGCVLFDSQDIRNVSLRSLRSQMAVVAQRTVIFADTVRANIAYGQPDIPLERVIDAAQQAYAHEFIELLPQGYDTVLSESGENLSGGQRQRLSIARAILRDPQILILDEATSSIDADSEAKITRALVEFTTSRTCFVVAHRFATVMAADSIAVMDEGRVVATGTHAQLMKTCPLYHGLYETQLHHDV
ncbi:MAG: ATP-binding cassette domain-containing protein [Actinobacteria bacterium]|nr:ATP-binding cassette domain-containing protein [Actinomycetota bacterium]